ncbi:MAG TPA: phage recombination protein Bet [Vicinamibacterales bacterium]|nr:phage recombination protein Bet [Vicinamibacterales bacterium]
MAARKKTGVTEDPEERPAAQAPVQALVAVADGGFTRDQIDLIKRTVADGCTDDELKLFLYTAQHLRLDPLTRQIHAVKRRRKNRTGAWEDYMVIQVGIDGYRATADRTHAYAPGPAPVFDYRPNYGGGAVPYSCTVTVKKLVAGTWHDVQATAFMDEYVQRSNEGAPSGLWGKMPHGQLAKCAEALALRKAFPQQMSGVYTDDEMGQADREPSKVAELPAPVATPTPELAAPAGKPSPEDETWGQVRRDIRKLLETKDGYGKPAVPAWIVERAHASLADPTRQTKAGYEQIRGALERGIDTGLWPAQEETAPVPEGKGPSREQQKALREAKKAAKAQAETEATPEAPAGPWTPPGSWTDYLDKLLALTRDESYNGKVAMFLVKPESQNPETWWWGLKRVRDRLVEAGVGADMPVAPHDLTEWVKANSKGEKL